MMKLRISAAALLLMGGIVPGLFSLSAQALPHRFENINATDGLINTSVSSIVQDEAGFLWFGTQAGLHRYDGYDMQLFTNEPFVLNSLSNQLVQSMHLGDGNKLWVGTYGGLNLFDLETYNITRYPHNPEDRRSISDNVVTAIETDQEGTIWAATLNGLNRLDDPEAGIFTRFNLPNNTVRALYRDESGNLWIGSLGGLSLLEKDPAGEYAFRHYTMEDGLSSNYVMTITGDADGNLLLGTWDGGVLEFSPESGDIRELPLPRVPYYTLMLNKDGDLLAGTWGHGLFSYDPESATYFHYQHDRNDDKSLAHDIVYSLYQDPTEVIWIGTNGNGISKLDPHKSDFDYLRSLGLSPSDLGEGRINAIYPLSDEDILLATQTSGIVRIKNGAIINYRHDPERADSLADNRINSFLRLDSDQVLVATHSGILSWDPATESFSRAQIDPDPEGIINQNLIVYGIKKDNHDGIWINTYSEGVFHLDRNGVMTHHSHSADDRSSISDNLVFTLLVDSKDRIWAATNLGISLFDPETGEWRRYLHDVDDRNSIASDSTRTLFEDRQGRIWIGTRAGGVSLYEEDSGTFRNFLISDGLSSNVVAAILQAPNDELFISTANGLNVLDPESGTIRIIDERNGLQVRDFSSGSAKLSNGDMLFGAFANITRIGSDFLIPTRPTDSRTLITDIQVMNQPYTEQGPSYRVNSITLPYDQNWIAFYFTATDFSSPNSNRFRYRLEGIENDWTVVSGRRFAEYTNLPPGRYKFVVEGTSDHSSWTGSAATIELHISPPWWATTWFRILAAVLSGLLLWYIISTRTRALSIQNQLLEKKVSERTAELELELLERKRTQDELRIANRRAEAANIAKSQFLANVSHEIRTPLNGIIGMTSLLQDTELDTEQQRYTQALGTSGEALLTLINDVLDFSKIEAGKLELENQNFNLEGIIDDMCEMLSVRAYQKGLELIINIDSNVPVSLRGDATRLRQILINLVGNAVKFTSQGEISIHLSSTQLQMNEISLRCEITDSGIGIEEDKIDSLFTPFTQLDTGFDFKQGGSGLGLSICKQLTDMLGGSIGVHSKPDQGSTFWFTSRFQVTEPARPSKHDDLAGTRFVVFDKHPGVRRSISLQLETWGCICRETSDESSLLTQPDTEIIIAQYRDIYGTIFNQLLEQQEHNKLILMRELGRYTQPSSELATVPCIDKPVRPWILSQAINRVLQLPESDHDQHISLNRELQMEKLSWTPRILIAEDAPINQDVAIALVTKLGCKAIAVGNGKEAVEALRYISYDLVFMDCQMPVMDGYTATRIIRDPDSGVLNPQIPIIAMTAYAMSGDREKCIECGMNDYVPKPVNGREIRDILFRWLEEPVQTESSSTERTSQQKEKLFDRQDLQERLMNDTSLVESMITRYMSELPEQISELEKAHTAADFELLRQQAHKISGSAANLGSPALRNRAAEIETCCTSKRFEELDQRMENLRDVFSQLQELFSKN
ncbi:hybrid sensor histidine kinase/response regulator [Spirochaeta dissipatitropha]